MRALLICLAAVLIGAVALRATTLEQLAAAPERWPAEATVTAATRATVLKDGQPAGAMLVGSGRTIAVLRVTATSVVGRIGATEVELPADKTDLLARAVTIGGETTAATTVSPAPTANAPAPANTNAAAANTRARATAPARASARAIPDVPPTRLQAEIGNRLVALEGGRVQPFDNRRLNGVKFFGLYFSASWCGPCREFTPELVRDYAALKRLYPEFEIVFVSSDRSEADMHGYLRDDAMPWPAVTFNERGYRPLRKHAGSGIPCLVLVDEEGKVLSDSYRWGRYVGPATVVEDTWKILKEHRRKLAAAQKQ